MNRRSAAGQGAVARHDRPVHRPARDRGRGRVERAAQRLVDVAAVAGVLLALAAVIALTTGMRPVALLSGSMAPTMPTGTLVVTRPVAASDIRVGDILTVTAPTGVTVTHRVTAIDDDDGRVRVTLRGDANAAPDAGTYDVSNGAARVVGHLPHVGRLLSPATVPVLLAGAVALLVLGLLPTRKKPRVEEATRPHTRHDRSS